MSVPFLVLVLLFLPHLPLLRLRQAFKLEHATHRGAPASIVVRCEKAVSSREGFFRGCVTIETVSCNEYLGS